MIDRIAAGRLPPKHHLAFRDEEGRLLHEECWTREGFDGPYTILYHRHRPHEQRARAAAHGWRTPEPAAPGALAKRHFRSGRLPAGGPAVDARRPLLVNDDLAVSVVRPDAPDPVYVANGAGDDLFFVLEGGGVLRSPLGDVRFEREDYVCVPRGLVHRFLPDPGPQHWLAVEARGGLHVPRQFRNEAGQLRMDAPYSHRDFRRPEFRGPVDEGLRELVVKRGDAFHGFALVASPLDVVGWDGTVYPWAFPIANFQPRVSSVHLPPTWHGTFAARGALVCSFVPRPVDFHPDAIPCPYPHSSVDCDEVLFYARGNFTSRRGVGPGSLSLHPAGIPHGPHPGAYEASLGTTRTEELAVMIDTFRPLRATTAAREIEDPDYMESFLG
jgi:homogentisate 1,2-dioxygenase